MQTPIFFRPGQQIKTFELYRKKTSINTIGRVGYAPEQAPIGAIKGSISQAKQKEMERWGQMGHPISHTVVIRGRTQAQAEDVISLGVRRFYVQGKDDPSELGIFSILYCEEKFGAGTTPTPDEPTPYKAEGELNEH